MSIEKSSFFHNDAAFNPMLVGCNGGGGHNIAAIAINAYLKRVFEGKVSLDSYDPVLIEDKPSEDPVRRQIQKGLDIMSEPYLGPLVKSLLELTPYPEFPDVKDILTEIVSISNKQKGKKRSYIDMLLDVYPGGYESAAIWNVLQRADKTKILKKLIGLQAKSDRDNHDAVYTYFLEKLQKAKDDGHPYTEIISTQAMSLPALCDAVAAYNKNNPGQSVEIHQYMTDLPTKGAVHFFNALSSLRDDQQAQMRVYGVGLNDDVLTHFFPEGNQFKGTYDIPYQDNPMIRPGFTDPQCDKSDSFDTTTTLDLGKEGSYEIGAGEEIATIMLGSQAGKDTASYIESLLESGISRVFVFGGKTESVAEKINDIYGRHPEYKTDPKYKDRIIPLGFIDDAKLITPLMTRSNIIVTRGGGMSTMEQMAMPHNPKQTILFHHADSPNPELTSGISWEDDNIEVLTQFLKEKGVHTQKTSPERAQRHIAEARIIAALKNPDWNMDIEQVNLYIKSLSPLSLKQCLRWIDNNEASECQRHFSVFVKKEQTLAAVQEKRTWKLCEKLNTLCERGIQRLEEKLQNKLDGREEWEGYLNEATGKYDLERFLQDVNQEKIKVSSTSLQKLVVCHNEMRGLQASIDPKRQESIISREKDFISLYRRPEMKEAIHSLRDSFLIHIFHEIAYLLAKLRLFKSLKHFFTPDLQLRKQVDKLEEVLAPPVAVN